MIVHDCIQGTIQWERARLGVVTASAVSSVVTNGLKLSKSREEYMAQLIAERLLGTSVEEFHGTWWTERGKELESEAQKYFMFITDRVPKAVGFVYRDESRATGCSPDWFIMDGDQVECGLELKCPNAKKHIQYRLTGECPKAYWLQVQYSMWVTGFDYWYFMSYFPGLPTFLLKVDRDADVMAAFDKHIPKFVAEVAEHTARLKPDYEATESGE